jgi:RES domain
MTTALTAARPGGRLHRVGRAPDAWAWPPWAYAGEDGTFGNRFDDPAGEYRVLYASSQRVGPFLETLARYRTDPALRLGDDIENWAIFEGSELYEKASEKIGRDDPDLVMALEVLGLVMAS